jgi:hypothetical protein
MKRLWLLLITILCVSEIYADGAKYLIIAPDSFVSAVQPLADWKTKKGVLAKVVPLSVAGNTAVQIRNYILNAYNTWQIRPEYILLAGLGTVVPYYNDTSDDYFADMIGNYQIELSIGRFPCTTISQCQNIVNKTLSYEHTPFMNDTTWYSKGTTIVNEVNTPYPDTIWWENVRYIHNFWRNYNYVQIDSFSRLRGNNSTNIMDALNNGRAFVVYRGWAVVNWWTPFTLNPSNLTNGLKLPIIVTGADCEMMSLSSSGYLGDLFLNAGSVTTPKGAIGYFSTIVRDVSLTTNVQRGNAVKDFFKAIFEENIYHMGDATRRTKFVIDSLYSNQIRYQEWNLFGDPELNLWTAVPKPLSATYDTIIQPTPSNVTVAVMSNGVPVPNALICLMKDTTIYEYSYTDNTGIIVFSISPQDTGTISITVTARNCHPLEGIIRVVSSGIEENKMFQASSFTLHVFPNPAKSLSVIRYSIPVKANVSLQLFDISGRLVKTLTNQEKNVGNYSFIWNGTDDNDQKVSEGVYFCILKTDKKTLKQKFLIVK